MKKSFVSPKVELRESATDGKGIFAKEKISQGEVIVDSRNNPGTYMPEPEAEEIFKKGRDYMLQVDDNLFAVTTEKEILEEADYINHSCDPNCGIQGSLVFIAMRDIEPGEEITFDYAMSESSKFTIDCNCGKSSCRKKITGEDWKLQELQNKYNGFFSDYLQKKIDLQ
ncbi:SET domain-containing protein [Patescibacteria group bacterium]